jgi:AraC-like DNA-binding protein
MINLHPASRIEQNTAKSTMELYRHNDLRLCLLAVADQPETSAELMQRRIIHFYFLLEGQAVFQFGPHYARELTRQRNFLFFNPDADLAFQLSMQPNSKLVLLEISLEHLHQLFVHEPLPFLKPENINRKFYDEKEIPSGLMVTLHQLFTARVSPSATRLFYQGKIFEILSLNFSETKPDRESCPFLNDEETVRKIKHAKEHILKHVNNPPGLRELARLCGLNEYQLKVGFKEIYGNTVFGFLLDHKLDHSRTLLDTGKYQVNEVAFEMGYANPSHFIAAFKKRFGVTPKKYLMNRTPKKSVGGTAVIS